MACIVFVGLCNHSHDVPRRSRKINYSISVCASFILSCTWYDWRLSTLLGSLGICMAIFLATGHGAPVMGDERYSCF